MTEKRKNIVLSWIIFILFLILVEALIFRGITPLLLTLVKLIYGEVSNFFFVLKKIILLISIFITIEICYLFFFKTKNGEKMRTRFLEINKDIFKKSK